MTNAGDLELRIDETAWNRLADLEGLIIRSFEMAIAVGASLPDQTNGETTQTITGATIVLSDDATLEQLNSQWRAKPKPTNILSFPAPKGEKNDNGNRYLGDMILAYGVVVDEAAQQGKALETHLCHLVIHGALHLLGFDHLEIEEAEQMEDHERAAMKALNLPDPYLPVSAKQENAGK